MLDGLLNVLFPPRCFGCGAFLLKTERDQCCEACEHTVFEVRSPKCPRCAWPRDDVSRDIECVRCLDETPAFERIHALWEYEGAVSDAIRASKGGDDPAQLRDLTRRARAWLAELADQHRGWRWTTPPPTRNALRKRGWDPALTALRHGVRGLNVEIRHPLTKRPSAGPKQARLTAEQRRAALSGAFIASDRIDGNWIVFDDVMTTGTTMREVAQALRAAGASQVVGVVLARSL